MTIQRQEIIACKWNNIILVFVPGFLSSITNKRFTGSDYMNNTANVCSETASLRKFRCSPLEASLLHILSAFCVVFYVAHINGGPGWLNELGSSIT